MVCLIAHTRCFNVACSCTSAPWPKTRIHQTDVPLRDSPLTRAAAATGAEFQTVEHRLVPKIYKQPRRPLSHKRRALKLQAVTAITGLAHRSNMHTPCLPMYGDIHEEQLVRARDADPLKGACFISQDPSDGAEACHLFDRATHPDVVSKRSQSSMRWVNGSLFR